MGIILILAYAAAGYWSIGRVFRVGSLFMGTFMRVLFGVLLGWLFVPIAIIKKILHIF
ncbi:MAG: hypothetical protein LBN30_05715 [Oscillospiraceae bacterium]|nr:hypothetical protein [Oscillospiraceae bacterium]